MHINACKNNTNYQNLKQYIAAILKFKNNTIVCVNELL